ncbi:hypothetical protein ABEB36_005341 [Hypothenemus hampei]|uniref:Uncharacterized protein n=1 Tax=Hypothenemus hampei TaxID=57062 RepID=A0ABD1EXX7_HYPHA
MTSEDEYFDSIEDTEFEECCSFCNDKYNERESDIDEMESPNELSHLVPFYLGNVDKSEVDSIKNESKTNTSVNTKLKRRNPLLSITDQRKNRSYLTMFYARTGGSNKNQDTTRTTCISPKSNICCVNTERNFYYESANSTGFLESDGNEKGLQDVRFNYDSKELLGNNLISVSETLVNSLVPTRQWTKRDSAKSKTKPIKLGELGGLGPNIVHDKLELLRKRQNYGKTVSEKNRIKILENKVVRKLKEEIRENNKF